MQNYKKCILCAKKGMMEFSLFILDSVLNFYQIVYLEKKNLFSISDALSINLLHVQYIFEHCINDFLYCTCIVYGNHGMNR